MISCSSTKAGQAWGYEDVKSDREIYLPKSSMSVHGMKTMPWVVDGAAGMQAQVVTGLGQRGVAPARERMLNVP